MYSDWTAAALHFIAKLEEGFAPDITLADRKKTLRAEAWRFHQGTSWGKKVWSRESRKYLERHGLPPKTVNPRSNDAQKIFAPDIMFPWRRESS